MSAEYSWLRDLVQRARKARINEIIVEAAMVGERQTICRRMIDQAEEWLANPAREFAVTRLGRWVIRVSDSMDESVEDGAAILDALEAAYKVVESVPTVLDALAAAQRSAVEARERAEKAEELGRSTLHTLQRFAAVLTDEQRAAILADVEAEVRSWVTSTSS